MQDCSKPGALAMELLQFCAKPSISWVWDVMLYLIGSIWSWWRHQMETFSALPAICAGNSPVPGEFPAQRPVTRSFDVFFDLHPNKRLSKQSRGWWFETPSCSSWRHRNVHATSATLSINYGSWNPLPIVLLRVLRCMLPVNSLWVNIG